MLFRDPVQIGEPQPLLEVHAAARQDVLPGWRRLARRQRVDRGVEDRRAQTGQLLLQGLAEGQPDVGAASHRRAGRRLQIRVGELRHELLARAVVMVAVVDPEQLQVAQQPVPELRVDTLRMGEDLFQEIADLQDVPAHLVVEDVAPGERRAVQIERQHPLLAGEPVEAVGVQTRHGELVHRLQQVGPRVGVLRRLHRVLSSAPARVHSQGGDRNDHPKSGQEIGSPLHPAVARGAPHGPRKADQYTRYAAAV